MNEDNYLKSSCKECGNHIEYPPASAGTVLVCPHCGQWTELPGDLVPKPAAGSGLSLKLVLGVSFIVVAVGAGGFFLLRNRNPSGNNPPTPAPITVVIPVTNVPPPKAPSPPPAVVEKHPKSPDDLKVGSVELEKTKGNSLVYAVGTVTNDSEYQRFGVRVELDLFNQQGKKLKATSKDYINLIEPHHEWQFHALIPDTKAASAKVSSLKEEE